jgi:fibronectin-binding autotransporter adhesin
MLLRRAAYIASLSFLFSFSLNGAAWAANDVWDNNPGGNWENGLNWVDGSTPGTGDTATFNLAATYSATFGVAPTAIQALTVSAGTVTFQSSGGAKTLNVNSGGVQDVAVTGASTLLTLGTSGNPLNLTAGDDLSVQSGATLDVLFGSDVVANDLTANGLNGTLRVNGSGSSLTLNSAAQHLIANTLPGSLLFQNSSTGNSITGGLRIADNATGVTGSVSITGGSTVNLGGNLTLASANVASQNGSLTINGAGSSLTQSGASTITVGATTNGTAAINIGTTANGGALITGSGQLTINPTGTVTIGGAGATGTLNANGDVLINGGTLQRTTNGSQFNLATGKTMTIQNGGLFSFSGSYNAATNAVYNVTGANSRFNFLGAINLITGSQANISAGGSILGEGGINVGNSGASNGILVIDGATSTATANDESAFGGSGNSATVTFSNSAVGNFLNGIEIADDATVGTAAVVNVLSNADLNVGSLSLATQGGTATLNINGSGSAVTQSGAASLTVGHSSTGSAAINIGTTVSGGTLTTGTGLFTINRTGTVLIGGGANFGTLNANGNVTIDDGVLERAANLGNAFTLAPGKTMTIQNGGRATFNGSYTTATNATYNITGANSKLETFSNIAQIENGALIDISSGGLLSAGTRLVIGDGALVVDGSGSSAAGNSFASVWGQNGDTASATFRNGATGSFLPGLELANFATAGTTALVDIQSGATVNVGDFSLATIGGATTLATLTIDGVGSAVTLSTNSDMVVGHSSTGSAIINVQSGGALTVGAGGSTVLNATGTINIDGGTADLKLLFNNGGTLNFTAGALSLAGGLIVGPSGVFDTDLTLDTNKQLTVDGTTTIDPSHTLSLNGGTFSTGGLVVNGTLDFNAGTLAITGAGGLTIGSGGVFGSILSLGPGRTLNVINTTTINSGATLVLENAASFSSGTVNNNGEIVLDGPSAVLPASVVNNFGLLRGTGRIDALLSNQPAGEVRVAAGEQLQFLDAGSSFNSGRINLLGGTVEFTQSALTNAVSGQIIGQGSIIADATLNSGTMAFSGAANVLGDVTNNVSGKIISSGGGPTTFFDDMVNNGEIRTSPGSFTVFFGALSGSGSFTSTGTVNIEGDLAPGSSPAAVSFGGDLAFGSTASAQIELGGTTPGSEYDVLDVSGAASLAGTLEVSLLGGYEPAIGDTFDIITAAGGIDGTFDIESLPDLSGLLWSVDYEPNKVVLEAIAEFTADFDRDRDVDGDDLTIWQSAYSTNALADADGDGDSDGRDFLAWQRQFGSGAALVASSQAVPEPSCLALLFGLIFLRRTGS